MLSSLPRALHRNRVFTYKGNPVDNIRKSFETACKHASIFDFVFHDLRHTAVTNMRRKDVKIEIAMAAVGHKSIAMFKRYRKIEKEDMEEVKGRN